MNNGYFFPPFAPPGYATQPQMFRQHQDAEQSENESDCEQSDSDEPSPAESKKLAQLERRLAELESQKASENVTSKLKDLSLKDDPLPKDSFAEAMRRKPKPAYVPVIKTPMGRANALKTLRDQTSKPYKGQKIPGTIEEEIEHWVFTEPGVSGKADLCLHYYKPPRKPKKGKGVGVAPKSAYALQAGCTKIARGGKCFHQHSIIVCPEETLRWVTFEKLESLLRISFDIMRAQKITALDFDEELKELQSRWRNVHGVIVETEAPTKPLTVPRSKQQEEADRLNQVRDKPLRDYDRGLGNDEFITDAEKVKEERLIERLLSRIRCSVELADDPEAADDGYKAHDELCARCTDPVNKLSYIAKTGLYYIRFELKAIREKAKEVLRENEAAP
ncbi:hypothetical protein FKW77_005487 [Venturia effusa]|uniref:Uncharacterized protein n=1 Tax=Venturia effusa TaxID=50376 RepID=A0A517KWD2_9PEZI|nr:hypothetical protein FKW77_005487 [Venturia effusa]